MEDLWYALVHIRTAGLVENFARMGVERVVSYIVGHHDHDSLIRHPALPQDLVGLWQARLSRQL